MRLVIDDRNPFAGPSSRSLERGGGDGLPPEDSNWSMTIGSDNDGGMTDRSGREKACAEHDGRPTDGPTVGCGPWSGLRTRGGGPFRRPGLQRTFFLFVARRTFGVNAFSKFPDRLPTTGSLEIQIHGLLKRPARRARDWPGLLRIVEPHWFSSSRFRPSRIALPRSS